MNQPDVQEEPLNNVELESAILGLRMALTPEEEVEAREHFLTVLRDSTLSVPTVNPTPTAPDGSICRTPTSRSSSRRLRKASAAFPASPRWGSCAARCRTSRTACS